jgi:hypothetical protein
MLTLYRLAHVLIAFVWFAAVFAAHWNAMQARRATTWAARATLFSVNRDLATRVALPMLFMVGLVGNIYAMQMGYTMKTSLSFMVANGLWAAMVLVALFVELPAAGALGRCRTPRRPRAPRATRPAGTASSSAGAPRMVRSCWASSSCWA